MSGVGLEVKLEDAEIRRALRKLQRFAKGGLRPAFEEIGGYLESSTRRRFETQTDPEGEPWKPSHRAIEQQGQTLTDTSRLRDSFASFAGDTRLVHGTNVAYAAPHQFGGKTAPRTIRPKSKRALWWPGARHPVKSVRHPGSVVPRRSFLGISPRDAEAIAAIVNARMRRAWT